MDAVVIFIICLLFMYGKYTSNTQEIVIEKAPPKMNDFLYEDDEAFTKYVKIFKSQGGKVT